MHDRILQCLKSRRHVSWSMDAVVVPGDRLCTTTEAAPGTGTFVKDGKHICAALVGQKELVPPAASATDQRPTVQVVRGVGPVVPKVDDVVTGKVTRINPRLAVLDILCVGTKPLDQPFQGSIRLQDVRLTEVDKLEIYSCFRPGDIVRAQVLSLGDSRSFFLTTAKNELGVVYAKGTLSGAPMVAISWQEMQCPVTKAIEKRKVAKVSA